MDYLDAIRKKTLELATIHALLNRDAGEKQEQLAEKEKKLFEWFMDQFEVSKVIFAKYLTFRQAVDGFERQTMNWKNGCKRITWILSIGVFIFWISFDIVCLFRWGSSLGFWIVLGFGVLNFLLAWVVYYAGLYIVRGFCGTQRGDQKIIGKSESLRSRREDPISKALLDSSI